MVGCIVRVLADKGFTVVRWYRKILPGPEERSKVFLAEETTEGVLHFVAQKAMEQPERHIFVG